MPALEEMVYSLNEPISQTEEYSVLQDVRNTYSLTHFGQKM